jgi:peptidoglycan lytic transglycosylase
MSLPKPKIAKPYSERRLLVCGHGRIASLVMAALVLTLGACSSGPGRRQLGSHPPVQGGYKIGVPYQIGGVWYYPKENFSYDHTGIASWYGHPFHGHTSASGEQYDMRAMTAAHKTLPMPSLVEVTNLDNGRHAVLRINDRGPFVSGRIIDVSRAAAHKLGFEGAGTARVRVRILERESRQMKQLALANMNSKANEVAARRQREAETGTLVAAKLPEYRPAEQPVARSVERKSYTTIASSRGDTITPAPAAKPRISAPETTSRPVSKRGTIAVTDLPPSGGGATGAGEGVYRREAPTGSYGSSGSQGLARAQTGTGLGRVASRREHVARPMASAIHTARPVTPRAAANSRPVLRARGTSRELPGRIFVQAGAFRDRSNANRLHSRLAKLGSVQVVPVRVGGARYFRVRVGPVASAIQGNRLLARVVGAGYPRAQIVID